MSLTDNVVRLRIADGHSVDQVAASTRLPASLIQAIENGRVQVPPKVVRALAQHFRVSEAELLG
ncbi:helix-turn-helix domain-containing protein [Aureimonas pseudogalii]|uniref:Cytoskeletal protein RodZ n=1 Tax=Aureimonas pseudogalii TaxID=1744844 RepID=A0A7W6EDP7_9HYPH|nr:helix-turn-helix transcriptional regulator [Aureimonas pseudogalii]MBB3996313.1 cytoskeletal protein RodZ [Aureimonas pseudogalii]